MLIIGEKEDLDNTVSVRKHGSGDFGVMQLEAFVEYFNNEIKNMLEF
jgi:threonyl-tRNA synthetase